jgi:hypothetical protein
MIRCRNCNLVIINNVYNNIKWWWNGMTAKESIFNERKFGLMAILLIYRYLINQFGWFTF